MPPLALAQVRRELPLWAVLALNLFELNRRSGPAVDISYPGGHAHEVCECEPEVGARAAVATTTAAPAAAGLQFEDAIVGALAGLPGWCFALFHLLKKCALWSRRRQHRRRPRPVFVEDSDGDSELEAAREAARTIRG